MKSLKLYLHHLRHQLCEASLLTGDVKLRLILKFRYDMLPCSTFSIHKQCEMGDAEGTPII